MDTDAGNYRYCPRCRCEYRPGFDICTDCGVDLVDVRPGSQTPGEVGAGADAEALQSWVGSDPVAIYTTLNEVEAHVVRSALVAADIPSMVFSSGHGGYYGHAISLAAFPHRVMIHKDDEAEARELLAAQFPEGAAPGPDE
jgi:hypothetical protein